MSDMTDGERFKEEMAALAAHERATDAALLELVIAALEAGDVAEALQDLRHWRDAARAMDRAAP